MELKRIIFDIGGGEKELFFSDGSVPYDAENARLLTELVKFVFIDAESLPSPSFAEIYFTLENEAYCATGKKGADGYSFLACEKKNKLVKLAEGREGIIAKLSEITGWDFLRALRAFIIDDAGFREFLRDPDGAFGALRYDEKMDELMRIAGKKLSQGRVAKAENKAEAKEREYKEAEKALGKTVSEHNQRLIQNASALNEIDARLNQIASDPKIRAAEEALREIDLDRELKSNEEELTRLESRLKYANRALSRAQEYEIKINKVYRYIELDKIRSDILTARRPDFERLSALQSRIEELKKSLEKTETKSGTRIITVAKSVFNERIDEERKKRINSEIDRLNREVETGIREENMLAGFIPEPDGADVLTWLKRFYSQGYSPLEAREAAYKKLNRITPELAAKKAAEDIEVIKKSREIALEKIEELHSELESCKIITETVVEEPLYSQFSETVSSLSSEEAASINAEIVSLEREAGIYSQKVAKYDGEIDALQIEELSGDKLDLYKLPEEELRRMKEDNDNSIKDNTRRKRKTLKKMREINEITEEQRRLIAERAAAPDFSREEECRNLIAAAVKETEKLNEKREKLTAVSDAEFQEALAVTEERVAKLKSEFEEAYSEARALREEYDLWLDAGDRIKSSGYEKLLEKAGRADGILRVMSKDRYGIMVDNGLYLVNEKDEEVKAKSLSDSDKLYAYISLLSVDNPFKFFVLDDSVRVESEVKNNIIKHAKCALPVLRDL